MALARYTVNCSTGESAQVVLTGAAATALAAVQTQAQSDLAQLSAGALAQLSAANALVAAIDAATTLTQLRTALHDLAVWSLPLVVIN